MPDNVYIDSGVDTPVSTDYVNIGGTDGHVQRVKLVDGTNNGTSLISGDSTYGLDVDVTRIPYVTLNSQANPFTVPIGVSGLISINGSTISVTGGSLPVTGSFYPSVQSVSGSNLHITTLPDIILASVNVVHVDDNNLSLSVDDGNGSLTIDGNIDTVSTIANVVHVDDNGVTLSIDDGNGSLTIDGNIDTVSTIANVVHVDDNGVTLSIDDGNSSITIDGNLDTLSTITNVVHIDDNGNSLTVDGTISINGGTITVTGETALAVTGSTASPSQIKIIGGRDYSTNTYYDLGVDNSGRINIVVGQSLPVFSADNTFVFISGQANLYADIMAQTNESGWSILDPPYERAIASHTSVGGVPALNVYVTTSGAGGGFLTAGGYNPTSGYSALALDNDGLLQINANPFNRIVNVSGDNLNITSLPDMTLASQISPFTTPINISGGNINITVTGSLPAGDNNIGNVDIVTMPSVTVSSLPSVTIGTMPNEGQQTMANSISVAIASNQSAVPVGVSGVHIIDGTSSDGKMFLVGGFDGLNYRAMATTTDGFVYVFPGDTFPVSGTVSVNGSTVAVTGGSLPVTGTFWQSIQNVSGSNLNIATLPTITLASQSSPFTTPVNISGSNLNLASQASPFTTAINVSGIYPNIHYSNIIYSGGTLTTSGVISFIPATASNYTYITDVMVTCSHATVGSVVQILEGSTITGNVLWLGYAAPAGGGFSHSFSMPRRTSNTNIEISARALTTASNVEVNINGFKSTI